MTSRIGIIGGPDLEQIKVAGLEKTNNPRVQLNQGELGVAGDFFSKLDSKAAGFKDFSQFPEVFFSEYPEFSEFNTEETKQAFLAEISRIDFKSILYPGTAESLRKAIEAYGSKLKRIYLWSQGDTKNTQQQNNKIARSGLRTSVLASAEAKAVEGKLHWSVMEDKFEGLEDKILADNPAGKVKVVVVEDRRENLVKVKKDLEGKADVFPIWASYGKTGKKLKAKKPEEFTREFGLYNGIESFADIAAHPERFAEAFTDAVVLVDFDGVLMNNEELRQVHGEALLKAVVSQIGENQDKRQELLNKIKERIQRKN